MLKISYHEEARDELAKSGRFYSSQSLELGNRFFEAFDRAVMDIRQFPHRFPKVEDDIRRCLLHKFPFGICYRIENETVRILAIAHSSRHPDYWKRRS
jgi:plasmid stabilization system protein ParE